MFLLVHEHLQQSSVLADLDLDFGVGPVEGAHLLGRQAFARFGDLDGGVADEGVVAASDDDLRGLVIGSVLLEEGGLDVGKGCVVVEGVLRKEQFQVYFVELHADCCVSGLDDFELPDLLDDLGLELLGAFLFVDVGEVFVLSFEGVPDVVEEFGPGLDGVVLVLGEYLSGSGAVEFVEGHVQEAKHVVNLDLVLLGVLFA